MKRPSAGCPHRPHTRYIPESNTTFCMKCAPPQSTSSSSSNSVSISEFLRNAEQSFRQVEQSRRLALCCLSEELTMNDLEEIRCKTKKQIDNTMLSILQRLESVQKRLYREVDQAVNERIELYDRVKKLIEECDRVSRECGEALSWKNSFDASASIAAANRLEEMLTFEHNHNKSKNNHHHCNNGRLNEDENEHNNIGNKSSNKSVRFTDQQQQNNNTNSSLFLSSSSAPSSSSSPLTEEISSILLRLHKTLDLEIESKTKRFALDESDLKIKILENEMEIPFAEFAVATKKQMEHYFPRKTNDEIEEAILLSAENPFPTSKFHHDRSHQKQNQQQSFLSRREVELDEQTEKSRMEKQFSPHHFYDSSSGGMSRSELLGRSPTTTRKNYFSSSPMKY